MADFGGYFVGSGNFRDLNGVIILAKVINGIPQKLPKYNLISAMTFEELEEKLGIKENYKMHLTPKELVWEIRKSSDKFFRFHPDNSTFDSKNLGQTINVDLLDPEYKVEDFYIVV